MTAVTVLTGPELRRRWTTAEKLRIVAESLPEGTNVAAIARRHNIHPEQLYYWRRQARTGVLTASAGGIDFAPMVIAPADCGAAAPKAECCSEAVIEVVLRNGQVVRLPAGVSRRRAVALIEALEGFGR